MARTTVAELAVYCDALSSRIDVVNGAIADLSAATQKTADQARETELAVVGLRHEIADARTQLTEARTQLKEARELSRTHEREAAVLRQELALLRQRLDDHLKRVEEWDRRRWGMYGLLVGAILSFAANLVVAVVRR